LHLFSTYTQSTPCTAETGNVLGQLALDLVNFFLEVLDPFVKGVVGVCN